ncbi:MAG TPA: helicase C-terminal domain-containing protein, partial [Streptosporangiaceae bacterium]
MTWPCASPESGAARGSRLARGADSSQSALAAAFRSSTARWAVPPRGLSCPATRISAAAGVSKQALTNRATLQITAFRGPDAEVRRQRLDGTWTGTFRVPRSYLAASAELAYAGNVHVAQGRTVDTAHLLVTDSLSRQALYVGMTRGRESNTAHVVTGTTAPPGRKPYEQAAPESVLASVMQRDDGDLSANEQI